MKPSLSIVIPAFNEEGNLEAAVSSVLTALQGHCSSYEILIFNDGSSDGTGKIADELARSNSNIKAFHNDGNKGLGYSLRKGFDLASKDYITWCAGDNPMLQESLSEMFSKTGQADVISSYVANPEFRSPARRFVSAAYVVIMNILFGLRLRYYNGFAIYRTDLVKKFRTSTQGFSFLAELLILLVKSGHSCVEVATHHRLRSHGKSNAFSLRNFLDIQKTLIRLIGVVYFKAGRMPAAKVPIS